jgi:predicted GNAT family N-acyltransferase
MKIAIEKFSTDNKSLFERACTIRTTVFVEEQGVPEDIEYDGKDCESVHYLLLLDGKPAVTSRYRDIKKAYKLERFATLKEFRGKGLGAKLLLKMIADLRDNGKYIYLNAQESAIGFYSKYGFEIVGDAFYEANIKHFKMVLISV